MRRVIFVAIRENSKNKKTRWWNYVKNVGYGQRQSYGLFWFVKTQKEGNKMVLEIFILNVIYTKEIYKLTFFSNFYKEISWNFFKILIFFYFQVYAAGRQALEREHAIR